MILTALQVEYEAVRDRLADLTRTNEGGTIFERGRLPGTRWSVVLALTGQGNDNASAVTTLAYSLYRPSVLFFVGVAGGLKDDLQIGDVVIGERIYDYRERQGPDGDHYRPRGWEAPWWLIRHVQLMKFGRDVPGRVLIKPIASGNVVLDRGTSELARRLRGNYDDAVAIEMESAGVCQAAHQAGKLDTLTIRGISDKADGAKRQADAGGSQERAAWSAAKTAVAILVSLARDGYAEGVARRSVTSPPEGADPGADAGAGGSTRRKGSQVGAPPVSGVAADVPSSGATRPAPEHPTPSPAPRPRLHASLLSAARRLRSPNKKTDGTSKRRRVLTACVALGLVGALITVLLSSQSHRRGGGKDSGLAACPASPANVQLRVAASIDLSASLAEAARHYGARSAPDGSCVSVKVYDLNSGTAMRALARGWREEDGDRPDVWSPAGSAWLTLARTRATGSAKTLLPETAQPIVTSPLTIAMPKPMATALGWPEYTLGWSKLAEWAADPAKFWKKVGHKEWGVFKLGKTNPLYSTSGLNATIGAYYAKTRTSAELSTRDIDLPKNQDFVRSIEKSVVHYGDTTLTFLANLRAADDQGGADEALKYISAVTVEEDAVVAYNEGYPCGAYSTDKACKKRPTRPHTPLVAFYPTDSRPSSDHPYVQLRGIGKPKEAVSADFLSYLHHTDIYAKYFAPYGFRTYKGSADSDDAPLISPRDGALPKTPVADYTAPDGKVLDEVQNVWPGLRRRANVLVLIDTSKSMDEKVPGNGATKMQLLRAAEPALFNGFADTDQVGLWKFSNAASLDGKHHYVPLVDIGPMGERLADHHGVTRGKELVDEVEGLVPNGATGLYGTIEAAVDTMRENYDPGAINAIVLLTDGRNEGVPPNPTLQDVLAKIGNPDKRIRVFTVAYGSEADQQDVNGKSVLEEISAATGARAYSAKNPKIISDVLTSVISNF
ncbi:phosphorylase family protein [Streptomyces sp. NPDC002671]